MAVKTWAANKAAGRSRFSDGRLRSAGGEHHLLVATAGGYFAYVKFDIDWANVKRITKAELVTTTKDTASHFGGVTGTYHIAMLTAAFSDNDGSVEGDYVLGGDQPAKSTTYAGGGKPFNSANGSINRAVITSIVDSWAPPTVIRSDGGAGRNMANHGLVLSPQTARMIVASDKHVDGTAHPYIELTYETIPAPGTVSLTGPVSPIAQIEGESFTGDFNPGEAGDKMSRVAIEVYLEGGAVQWTKDRVASASEAATAVFSEPVPALLRSGTAYEWRARAKNQRNEWTAWTAKFDLVVTTDPPTLDQLVPTGSKSTLNNVRFGARYLDENANPMASYRIQVRSETEPTDPDWDQTELYWDTGERPATLIESAPDTGTSGRTLRAPQTGAVVVSRGGVISAYYGGKALAPGTYSYRIRATDTLGGVSDWEYGEFTLTAGWEPDPSQQEFLTGYAARKVKSRIVIRDMNLHQQRVYLHRATGGTFSLSLDGHETSALDWDATAAEMKTAIDALTGVSAVVVTKVGSYYTIDFAATDTVTERIEIEDNNLTGSGVLAFAWPTRGPGKPVAIIEDAANIGAGEFHNSPGEFFFTLPAIHPQVGVIEPWQVHWALEVYRGEGWKEIAAGVLIDFDATEDDVVFHGVDYLGLLSFCLDERFNTEAAPDAPVVMFPGGGGGSKYVNEKIEDIVEDQIKRAVYGVDSPLGFLSVGAVATMEEQVTIFSTFKEQLGFIAGLIESHRAGTGKRTRIRVRKLISGTYEIVVEDNPGVDRDNIRFEYGGLVQGFRVVPFGDYGTRVNAIGRAFNALKVEYYVTQTPVPTGEPVDYFEKLYGRLPKVNLWQDISDRNDLIRRAKQFAKALGKLGKRVALGLRVDALSVKDGWDIADNLPIDIKRGVVDTSRYGSGYWTCWGWTFRVFPDGHTDLTLSLLPREDDEAPDPDLIPSEPINTGSEWSIGWSPPVVGVTTGVLFFDASTGITWELQEDGTWAQVAGTIPPPPDPPHSVVVGSRGIIQFDGTATVAAQVTIDTDTVTMPLLRRTVVAVTQREVSPGVPLWDDNQMLVSIPVGETQAQFESLLAGEPIYARAFNEDMYGQLSTEVTDDTTLPLDDTVPDAISFINTGVASEALSFDWEASDDADFSYYEVQIDDTTGFPSPLTYRLSVNRALLAFPPGTYFVRIRAVDRTGNAGPWTSETPMISRIVEEVENSVATVIIGPDGLTIEDGALTIRDEFGETVMTAIGFEGSWSDYVAHGLYNAVFRAGQTGAIPDGRTATLPYWTVSRTGSPTVTRTADTNFPGGHAIRFTPSAVDDTLLLESDPVSVVGLRSYLISVMFSWVDAGSALARLGMTVRWYDKDGASIGADEVMSPRDETIVGYFPPSGLSSPGRVVYPDPQMVEGLIAPKAAHFATVALQVAERTAHSATTRIYIGGLTFIPDPFAETGDYRTTRIGIMGVSNTGVEIENGILVQTTGAFGGTVTAPEIALGDGGALIGSGTVFPGSPTANDRYYRTDLGMEFYWSGTQWLSVNLYERAFDGGQTAFLAATAANLHRSMLPVHPQTGGDILVTGMEVVAFISGGGSALSGSHSWAVRLRSMVASGALTNMATVIFNSGASNTWRSGRVAVGVTLDLNTVLATEMDVTKVGTPGTIAVLGVSYAYRIIAT